MATKRSNKSNIREVSSQDEEQPTGSGAREGTENQQANRNGGEDIIELKSLTLNTYSIIYVADPMSWAFLYGIVFFLIQASLLAFALIGAFDFFGEQCQFESSKICDTIEFDHRFDPFPIQKKYVDFPSRLNVVIDSEGSYPLYRNKAVYYYVYSSDSPLSGIMNVIVFFGRRFYFVEVEWATLFDQETESTVPLALVEYIQGDDRTFFELVDNATGVTPLFVSEAMDLGTPNEKPAPTDVAWHLVSMDIWGSRLGIGASINTRLLCATCNATHGPYCELAGACDEATSTCDCDDGFEGPLCEYYDPFFVADNT